MTWVGPFAGSVPPSWESVVRVQESLSWESAGSGCIRGSVALVGVRGIGSIVTTAAAITAVSATTTTATAAALTTATAITTTAAAATAVAAMTTTTTGASPAAGAVFYAKIL